MPKYSENTKSILDSSLYFDILENKGVKSLKIVRSPDFEKLIGKQIPIDVEHTWSYGDNLFKLSNQYFKSYDDWWVIALLNGKPTDAHYSIGDIVYIPANPYYIKEVLR